jgi:hypothetical protein
MYFITANLWLALAYVVFMGQRWERSEPARYSFFGIGHPLSPTEYNFLVGAPVVMALICFILFARTRANHQPKRGPA